MVQLFSNPNPIRGGINIHIMAKLDRISFNSGFCNRYLKDQQKYVFMTKPERSRTGTEIGFIFTNNPHLFDGIAPYNVSWHSRGNHASVYAKNYFQENNLEMQAYDGKHLVHEKKDGKIGDYLAVVVK